MSKTHPAVEAYCSLDFDLDGPIAADLMSGLDGEARSLSIRLTEPIHETPADITPVMSAWYGRHVAALRSEALDAVSAVLGATGDATRGVFLERALAIEDRERIKQIRAVDEKSRAAHPSHYLRFEGAEVDFSKARDSYEDLRARHGREARLTPWWYLPLLCFVGVFDAMINFESFSAISYFTPAIALGVTMVTAFAFALSSHCHGTVLRQYESRFGDHRRDADRAAAWQIFSLGTLALLIALALVWYARSSFLSERLVEIAVVGGEAPSPFVVIGGSMIGNLVVWIVGVLLAYFAHDEDHHFPEALTDKRRAEKTMHALRETIQKPLRREFQRIEASFEKTREQAHRKQEALQDHPETREGQELFARLKQQDARVLAVLEAYRIRLVEVLRSGRTRFEQRPVRSEMETSRLAPDDYAAHPIKLNYL